MIGLLLGDARAGELEIVTSLVSTVEVAFAKSEGMTSALSPDIETKISDLWAPGGPIRTVELYPLVATRARNLIRDGVPRGWRVASERRYPPGHGETDGRGRVPHLRRPAESLRGSARLSDLRAAQRPAADRLSRYVACSTARSATRRRSSPEISCGETVRRAETLLEVLIAPPPKRRGLETRQREARERSARRE